MARNRRGSGLKRLLLLGASVPILFLSSCQRPKLNPTGLLGAMAQAGSILSNNPRQAAAFGGLGAYANIQSQQEAAQAGKSEINVNTYQQPQQAALKQEPVEIYERPAQTRWATTFAAERWVDRNGNAMFEENEFVGLNSETDYLTQEGASIILGLSTGGYQGSQAHFELWQLQEGAPVRIQTWDKVVPRAQGTFFNNYESAEPGIYAAKWFMDGDLVGEKSIIVTAAPETFSRTFP